LLLGVLGLVAATVGLGVNLPNIVVGDAGAVDYPGALAGVAGVGLVGVAFWTAVRGRRRRVKLLIVPAVLVLLQWWAVPVMNAALVTNAERPVSPDASGLGLDGAHDVTFPARDGVRLAGWYVPGSNGAAVIVMHGSHGSRADTLAHVRMLARAGYAVLTFDARGHGESDGRTNALGWTATDDVAGAVSFVRSQPGADPQRVAALGLSMGGEEALRAASDGVGLSAVVADGAGASTTDDNSLQSPGAIPRSVSWATMRAVELFGGGPEPAPLRRVVDQVRSPALLIASNREGELEMDTAFAEAIGDGATLWHVSDAGHTKALDRHPRLYAERVLTFLEAALRQEG
jgi:pimeloyl-ACP methyl ester carboxylesterase